MKIKILLFFKFILLINILSVNLLLGDNREVCKY